MDLRIWIFCLDPCGDRKTAYKATEKKVTSEVNKRNNDNSINKNRNVKVYKYKRKK